MNNVLFIILLNVVIIVIVAIFCAVFMSIRYLRDVMKKYRMSKSSNNRQKTI